MEKVKKVVGTLNITRQGKGISKQKVLSYIVLILAAAPTVVPHFSAYVSDGASRAMIGVAALLVIVARELQKDL